MVMIVSVDMKQERSWLLRESLPRLQQFAQQIGIMIQIVDLFWGVSEVAALDPEMYNIHLEQINLSRQYSSGPFFVVRYMTLILARLMLLCVVNISLSITSTITTTATRCASGCVVECRICNREVAGSNLGLGYFAPRSTQPSIPPGSVNEYQLRLGRQRQVWLIPIADERVGVQIKL